MWNLLRKTRRAYRANIFSTPEYESAISGVILFDETIRQTMDDGTPIPEYLASRGIHPGIKVDGLRNWLIILVKKSQKDWTD